MTDASGTLTISNSLFLASNSTTTFSLGGTNYFTSINLGTNSLTYGVLSFSTSPVPTAAAQATPLTYLVLLSQV